MRQVAFAEAGASSGHHRSRTREAPGPSRFAFFPSQESDRFIEQLPGKRPYPTPILTPCKQPGDSVLSLDQGVPEDAGWEKKKPPSPESPKQMAISCTVAPSEHYGSP